MVANEELNFLLTNRIPRRAATRFLGWFSKIERPWVARPSIAVWRLFSDVDLTDAAETTWPSMHACFTRSLKPGARRFVEQGVASPCDAIVGAHGPIAGDQVHQIKGAPYALSELLGSAKDATAMAGGSFVTLRLTAGMYHHFHAPCDLIVERVTYISGDCWNVNTPALKRVERLFCRNERAAIHCRLPDGRPLVLVAVAAVLVASIRLTFLDTRAAIRVGGPRTIAVGKAVARGMDMGWFEHGSTIVVLLPEGMALAGGIETDQHLRAGATLAF
ncbi:phosphatidylserine decarboxylase [Sphingomonas vulcanisoli]|uniref:phosphatidylserine decarboxylase n=2 Tax=Sphingomonas vulcanisoli TaxID=1658060 RepID=A0ABX0TT32_9SPHN|nr:archaetidylserine decarboxylase [Sphingomonas vulcanisoli]NIJ08677.1 phosphatidylserine decarboxylase [Sphingomonas vulcanisoli]